MVQIVPSGETDMFRFSWSRKAQKMRFIDSKDNSWFVTDFSGKWEILDARAPGELIVRCKLTIKNEIGSIELPDDCNLEDYADDVPDDSINGHWRLCYNRRQDMWRLKVDGVKHLSNSYLGIQNVTYSHTDKTAIFHDGPVFIDDQKVAHFKE